MNFAQNMSRNKFSRISKLYNGLWGKQKMGKAILLKNHQAMYFPIPKVACTSIKNICAQILDLQIPEGASAHDIYFPSIRTLDEIVRYDNYFKFAFVRNPWDRLVSCYGNKIKQDADINNRWFENGVSRGLSKYGVFKAGMSFEAFATAVIDIPDSEAEKHFRSQYTFIVRKNNDLIPDFIGKFESLSQDLSHICKSLKLENVEIPHLQKSSRYDYRDYYSQKIMEKVSERFYKDIEIFEYEMT